MTTPTTTEVLFVTKAPRPGEVKTRLARDIGNEAAARLHAAFVRTLAATIARFVHGAPTHRVRQAVLVRADDIPHQLLDEEVMQSSTTRWQQQVQQGESLGARLAHACAQRVQGNSPEPRVLIVGSDSPTLDELMLTCAEDALDTHDVVIGPSFDGGYYLIGMSSAHMTQVFDEITWSSEVVLKQTLERCRTHGLSVKLLGFWYDVDTLHDLEFLRTHLLDYIVASPATQHYSDLVRQLESFDASI